MKRTILITSTALAVAALSVTAVKSPPARETASGNIVYSNSFDSYADFDECTILDKNNDGICWDWREYQGKSFAHCLGTETNITANDWLITPGVALEAGHSYRMSVETQCLGEKEEKFECRWGSGYHVENLTNPAIPATVMGEDFQETSKTVEGIRIDITKSGEYRFAYHMMSDPGSNGVAVLSMKVTHLGLTGDLPEEEVLVYSEQFESPASFNTFKTYDMNGDGAVWSHDITKKCARYTYSGVNAANDWLITPAISLNVGRNYKIRFKASTASMPERLEVCMGRTDKPADQTVVLVESTDLAKRSEIELGNGLFKVANSGDWFIGFHAISDKDCDKIYIDDIEVYDTGANGETEDPGPEPPRGLPVPYSADMTQPGTFAEYSVVDANHDGRTWKYDPIFNTTLYTYSPDRDADDWLITPALAIEAGKNYRLTVTAASRGIEFPEKLEVMLGKGTELETYQTELIAPMELVMNLGEPALRLQSVPFHVDETGDFNIGIHAISVANMSDLIVNRIELEEVYLDAPTAVTELTARANETGDLKATLSFRAPTLNYAGETLGEPLSKIEVIRGEKLVKTLEGVKPGESVTVVDDDDEIAEGMNQYTVTPYVGEHAGDVAQVNVFIGNDVPVKLTGVGATDVDGAVRLEWDEAARVGKNGGVVYPSLVTYNVYRAEPVYELGMIIGINLYKLESVKGTSTVIDAPEMNIGAQEPAHYAVTAETSAGEGPAAYVNMIKGKCYPMPFTESFEGERLNSYMSVDTDAVGEKSGLYISANASDGDGGAIAFVSYEGDRYVAVFTGKIAVKGSTEPHLKFDARNAIGNNLLKVQVMTPDNSRHDLSELTPGDEYSTYDFDLSDYRDCLWVRFVIATEFPIYVNADYGNELDLDNIRVFDIDNGVETVIPGLGEGMFPCDVYSVEGHLLRKNATDLQGLSGIVIINGHKYRLR